MTNPTDPAASAPVTKVPVPTPGRVAMFKDKMGVWPGIIRAVNPDNPKQVDLVVLTAMSGAYMGKAALGVSYGKDQADHWWWPEDSPATMEI